MILEINEDELFVLLEAILNWDTSGYALKGKLETNRRLVQEKLEDLYEDLYDD